MQRMETIVNFLLLLLVVVFMVLIETILFTKERIWMHKNHKDSKLSEWYKFQKEVIRGQEYADVTPLRKANKDDSRMR